MTTIKINWMDGWGNNPRIELHDLNLCKPDVNLPYEKRGSLHRRNLPDGRVSYFHSNGKPCDGYGGAIFKGTLTTGEVFECRGAWSSRAACVNKLWPEDPIVDVEYGHIAGAVRLEFLMGVWQLQGPTDFGLALVGRYSATDWPVVQPTRDGKLKNSGDRIGLHLSPRGYEEALDFYRGWSTEDR